MTRRFFGGDAAVVNETGDVLFGQTGDVWSVEVGGNKVTDLLDPTMVPQQTITTDLNGKYHFWGPDDGTAVLWVDFGHGRWRATANDLPTRLAALESSALTAALVGVPNGLATLDAQGLLSASQRSADTTQAIADLQALTDALGIRVAALESHPTLWAQSVAPPHGAAGDDVWIDTN